MSNPSGDFASRIEILDPTLFSTIASESTPRDQRSMLALHAAARRAYGSFDYLEIGSPSAVHCKRWWPTPRAVRFFQLIPGQKRLRTNAASSRDIPKTAPRGCWITLPKFREQT
jgi:hypothetical protein